MSSELVKSSASKPPAVKKVVSAERKALRSEMNHLYGKIADSFKRRSHHGWVRP